MSDLDRIGLIAVGVSAVVWLAVRGMFWLAEWHWRRCPRNPREATPMSEAQPETVAGRQLDAEFGVGQFGRVTRLVLKAEAEARAAGAARYEAALQAVLDALDLPEYFENLATARARARALLAAPPLRSPERDQAVIEQLDALVIGFTPSRPAEERAERCPDCGISSAHTTLYHDEIPDHKWPA